MKTFIQVTLIALSLFVAGCATYYERNMKYHQQLQSNDYLKAEHTLDHIKMLKRSRNELLLLLEKGKLAHLRGEYQISNDFFNKADYLIEDFDKKITDHLIKYTVNPQLQSYESEDFEKIFIHFYKSLNYQYLGKTESALVEVRRMNIKLHELNDKYKKVKNKYTDDAFAHNLMGMLYEHSGDINNAFIAYRNAYKVYSKQNENSVYKHVTVPKQLKKDLLRTASELGFYNDVRLYEKEFDMKAPEKSNSKELIVFWENGLCPTKSEWSINFTPLPGHDGTVIFENDEFDISIPFPTRKYKDFKDLKFLRVAFPKYVDRNAHYQSASVSVNNQKYELELAEDLRSIAYRTLKDRFLREMSDALIRLAVKKSSEMAVSDQNEHIGTFVSVVNAITEKADTRHWQTLPEKIYYCRIPVPANTNAIKMTLNGSAYSNKSININIPVSNKRITFHNLHSLESQVPIFNY